MDWNHELGQMLLTGIYFFLGLILFGVGIWLMERFVPFSIRKELEEDQNVALGVVMGAALIGLSIILAAVLK